MLRTAPGAAGLKGGAPRTAGEAMARGGGRFESPQWRWRGGPGEGPGRGGGGPPGCPGDRRGRWSAAGGPGGGARWPAVSRCGRTATGEGGVGPEGAVGFPPDNVSHAVCWVTAMAVSLEGNPSLKGLKHLKLPATSDGIKATCWY